MFHGPGVQVVAFVPVAGPVPPPIMVVTPLEIASVICCAQMKWMCAVDSARGEDAAFAGEHLGGRADGHGDAVLDERISRMADAGDATVA